MVPFLIRARVSLSTPSPRFSSASAKARLGLQRPHKPKDLDMVYIVYEKEYIVYNCRTDST